jgi:hypothetical protein
VKSSPYLGTGKSLIDDDLHRARDAKREMVRQPNGAHRPTAELANEAEAVAYYSALRGVHGAYLGCSMQEHEPCRTPPRTPFEHAHEQSAGSSPMRLPWQTARSGALLPFGQRRRAFTVWLASGESRSATAGATAHQSVERFRVDG